MPNKFKTEEQRRNWYKYNSGYSKRNYKTITFKLNLTKDADVIDWFTSQGANGESFTDTIRKLVRNQIKK